MSASSGATKGQRYFSGVAVFLLLTVLFLPLNGGDELISATSNLPVSGGSDWRGEDQPWGQYGKTPTHNQTPPSHGPDGGPGLGNVSDVLELMTLEHPVVNWQVFETGEGSDAYGSIIGDFSASVSAPEAARERCGEGMLFPVMISSEISDGNRESFLNIVSGNDAKIAWRTSLGNTEAIRSTPMVHDIDADGHPEIIVVYDTASALNIDVWSPRLTCTESNWQVSGHSNELMWSYSDADVRIGSPSPHIWTANSDHDAVTQPLLADLELDGTPELVLAVVDDPENNPSVYVQSYTLTTTQPSSSDWSVNLDRGTHPSDPVWAKLDSTTTSILLTTIDSNSGNMWIWKIDGASGSLDWERVAVPGTDSDSDAPRLRLPGPVITQLDGDAAPEMVLTVPTDANGRTSGTGARFIGMDIASATEVFNFRAPNGYADTQPTPMDTDDDGISDRLCWATWYSDSSVTTSRKGMLGCTDISDENAVNEWVRDLERGSGTDNDEIAASPPFWLDIDGEGTPEILIGFGRRFWAFDGDTGASADINNEWSTPLTMPHRVWTAPALADVDGDGHLDVLFGDTLVSDRGVDLVPTLDNRGLSFNPAQADPGQSVTVTAQFSNMGTAEADDDVDAAILMNGVELRRERFTSSQPVAPSGEGGPMTFTADFTAQLGLHTFELVLDVNQNITEQREDNNRAFAEYLVVEPYVAELSGPLDPPRILPGNQEIIDIALISTGSRTADWTLTYDTQDLPEDWNFAPVVGQSLATIELVPQTPQTVSFEADVPASALGDASGAVSLLLSLDSDPSINVSLELPIEVLRTRGLDLTGPQGLNESNGVGRPGFTAKAWFMVENLGNADETTTTITWSAPSWGGSPSIHTLEGTQLYSITMAPGESKELVAHLPTPSSATYGTSTESTLTMCMGSGENALCESMPFTFTSQKFVLDPNHQRSLPDATLNWDLTGTLPTNGMVQWNMAEMGLLETGWTWSTSGDWSTNGTYLEAQGTPGELVTGELELVLPVNAVPKRHAFEAVDANDADAVFNGSLHVLQIYRAGLSLIEPTLANSDDIVSLNVTESHRFLLFLSNPGNGQDVFELDATVSATDSEFESEVEFTFYDPIKTLGPLSTGIGTVDIVLSEDVPAQVPFEITFSWTSEGGNGEVFDAVTVTVQAAPSHEWGVTSLNGTNHQTIPGEVLNLSLEVTNLGNAVDGITLVPHIEVQAVGNDIAQWESASVASTSLAVNASQVIWFLLDVPPNAWAGSQAEVTLLHMTSGYVVGETTLIIDVLPVSSWRLNLTGADLEIEPTGENLTIQLVHTGNAYETAYFAKAGAGWNITLPDAIEGIAPFSTVTFTVFVEPPVNAVAGEIGVLRIRVTGNDTSGSIEEEVPVRVGAQPNIIVDHRSAWTVNEQGGYPTAWIHNLGNDIAMVSVDVDGLPEGWSTQQGTQMILAPGDISGLPLQLTPATGWNGQRFLITLNVHHPILGTVAHNMEVAYGSISWAQTPVRDAYVGAHQSIEYHFAGAETPTVSSGLTLQVKGNAVNFNQPSTTGEHEVVFLSGSNSTNLSLYVLARTYPESSITCTFLPGVFDNLGRIPISGTVAQCDLMADDAEPLRAALTMITSRGERVPLQAEFWTVGTDARETVNLTVLDWTPKPGMFAVVLTGHDQYGRELVNLDREVISRAANWNIGINSLTADGDITVGIQRTGYSILEQAVCELFVEASGGWSTTYVVDIAYAEFAPVVSIENPNSIEKDEKITATVSCSVPFDIDDNLDDDEKSAFYKPEGLLSVSSNDVGWILGVAAVLVTLAWFGGLIRPPSTRNQVTKTPDSLPKDARKESASAVEKAENNAETTTGNVEPESDDIQVHVPEASNEETPPETEEGEHDSVPVIEVIEKTQPEVPATASGRLASLREELGEPGDAQLKGSIEDRMKDFFGDR